MKKLLVLPFLLLLSLVSIGQDEKKHYGFGLSGGSLNTPESIASGFSFYYGKDIIQTKNSSVSLSTNVKLGTEDRSGFVFPSNILLFLFYASINDKDQAQYVITKDTYVFFQIPIQVHYNFGLGSNPESEYNGGWYLGGGLNFCRLGYTDTSVTSHPLSFFGYEADGGIRVRRNLDINLSTTFSLKHPIGQMANPMFYQLTAIFLFPLWRD